MSFDALADVLRPYASLLVVARDEPGHYSLDTRHTMPNGKPLWFGAARAAKRYVGFHLMPIYVEPALLEGLDPALARRRHGKSCFNFRPRDEIPIAALARLVARGYALYAERGYVPSRTG